MDNTKRCCIIVYGCAKNQVDAEEMATRLQDAGFGLTPDAAEADVLIVHTCGFVEDAKKESVQGILEACEVAGKNEAGRDVPVIVTGCLSQRYPSDLLKEIPEIAGIAGTSAPRDIVEIVSSVFERKDKPNWVSEPGRGAPGAGGKRSLMTAGQTWAYLRVGEGCRHHCTYCAIPSMRGRLSSRPMDDVLAEARFLAGAGVRELNLIAQDLSDYGVDWDGRRHLPELVRKIAKVQGVAWIRMLYLRPDGVTGELADAMTDYRVAPYVDLPIEHGSGRILRRMGRPGPEAIMKAVETLRSRVPSIFIRTTVIAGFPGETESDLEETKSLLSAMGTHRVGVFPFSNEDGTPAERLPDHIPNAVAKERAEALRRFGLNLARVSSKSLVGREIPVVLVKPSVRPGYWVGRGPHQAPEVDGRVYVSLDPSHAMSPETFVDVRVHRAGVLDLFGNTENKPSPA